MPDDRIGAAPGATPAGQIPVSANNPCPFLRALVANGYVGGHVVPLSKLPETIGAASGETGFAEKKVRLETWLVAVIANGLGPLRVLKSATSGAVLDELRDGPLDKHGAGSRILDVDAKVHEDEIARLAGFGKDRKDPAGGIERGLTANRDRHLHGGQSQARRRCGALVLPYADEGRMAGAAEDPRQGRRRGALPQRRRSQDAVRRAATARADHGAAAEAARFLF